VQTGGVEGGGGGHSTPLAHASVVPPVHSVDVDVWQSMPAPQSVSVVQGPSSQMPVTGAGADEGAGATLGQSAASLAHAGGETTGSTLGTSGKMMQVKPLLQSESFVQSVARAGDANASAMAREPSAKTYLATEFLRIMESPVFWSRRGCVSA
jgi:hypothetical protein